jgi:carboxypeptidase T
MPFISKVLRISENPPLMNYFRLFALLILLNVDLMAQSDKYVRVEVPYSTDATENIAGSGLAVEHIHHEKVIVLEISTAELSLLTDRGVPFEISIDDLEAFYRERNKGKDINKIEEDFRTNKNYTVPQGFSLGTMAGFCTYDEMLAHLDNMHFHHPHLISQRDSIPGGQTIEGRPVYWMRISNQPDSLQSKPRVLYTALTHAREPGSMQQMLYFMYYLLENYESNPEIKSIVDHTELYFVPAVNPDGYIYNQNTFPDGGGMWRKNMRQNGNGSTGVDLNRNFGYNWGYNNFGSSPNPSSSTYRGTAPFSEPETQLLKTFAETYAFSIALNYHSYGNLLLHPWGFVSYLSSPHHYLFQEYGHQMTKENNYLYGLPGTLLYVINGDANDWMYGEQTTKPLCMSFIPELGNSDDGFWPPAERIIPQCQESLHQNLMAAKLAGFYAYQYDLAPENISGQTGWIRYGVKRIGMADLPYTVTVAPLNDAFLMLENSTTYTQSEIMEAVTDSVPYMLNPKLRPGEQIQYTLTLTADGFSTTDTISKVFGEGTTLFFDDCDDMSHWNSESWDASSERFYSPPFSIGNSPESFYPNNDSSNIILTQPVDLTGYDCAWMSFYISYDLNGGKDYVKMMVSGDDGENWVTVETRATEKHFVPGQPELPVYRGKQDEWKKDWLSLNQFCGEVILIGFWFKSDQAIGRAGFYFDDLKIEGIEQQLITRQIEIYPGWNNLSGLIIPENDSLDVIFGDYVSQLILLKNQMGSYQPDDPSNGLTTWDETSGYFLKAEAPFTLQLSGYPQTAYLLSLDEGWNLIPVLSSNPVAVANLETIPAGQIEVIKEAPGFGIFWPEWQVFSLGQLQTQRAYLIKLKQPALLKFESDR